MLVSIHSAARAGGRAGLLGEGEPADIERWPATAQAAFAEQYARGRRTRLIAEGMATFARGAVDIPAGSSREQFVARFNADERLQREFTTAECFVAYACAFGSGKARRTVARVQRI